MLPEFLSNEWFLVYGGLALTVLIIYVETGFPIGVIIPGGEMLLFISGLLCGTKWLEVNILFIIIPISIFAFMADLTGYSIGNKKGAALFEKQNNIYYKRKHLKRAAKYFHKFGMMGIILARFIPVIRTFTPLYHGAKETDFNKFFIFSGIGAILYVNILIVSGYFIGKEFPDLKLHLDYIIASVVVFIFITPIINLLRRSYKLQKEKKI
ncbi:MAG: VTT domain-containing protein [Cytophagaceae bacterium]|nr:VTT domain-containing protein [Cytophagaceae bacterium]